MPHDQSLLFDSVDSNLHLLDVDDKHLMEEIYRDNGSGWIKIGVVRDPVTRLLSAYLDLVRTWPARSKIASSHDHGSQKPHRQLWTDDSGEWFDAVARHRDLAGNECEQQQARADQQHNPRERWSGDRAWGGSRKGDEGPRRLQDEAVPTVPTFEELLYMLEDRLFTAPSAFRPAASLCGMGLSPFDTIIPFETLQVSTY